jgi:prevent-host-death family protein
MEVGIRELRANLSTWLARVKEGERVVVTERGLPVARLTSVEGAELLDRLGTEGLIRRPSRARRPSASIPRIAPAASVSDLVAEQRR